MESPEVEILEIPPLSPGESSLVDMHSLLNMLNVLFGEFTLLGFALRDDGELFRRALARCDSLRAHLSDPGESLRDAAAWPEIQADLAAQLEAELERHPDKRSAPEVQESVQNIHAVLSIFAVRAREVLARAQAPHAWVEIPIEELRADFFGVFAAIEKNSHGRYRIFYNLALQGPKDYYVDFAIESQSGRVVALPLVFKDVMRDLMANARKYTAPGGTISAGLYETETELKFTVSDTGCGIPADEIQSVFHYGRRGSNVGAIRTMGGGFGLTKAFLVTKQFGGRFWIRSRVGHGTRIRIVIPRSLGQA